MTSPGTALSARAALEHELLARVRSALAAFFDGPLPTKTRFDIFLKAKAEVEPAMMEHLGDAAFVPNEYRFALNRFSDILENEPDPAKARERATARLESEVRGEATRAFGERSTAALSASGVPSKRWIAVNDSATRLHHREANGQTVPVTAAFVVGGEAMRYPGDANASVAQTANCRCSVVGVDEASSATLDALRDPSEFYNYAEMDNGAGGRVRVDGREHTGADFDRGYSEDEMLSMYAYGNGDTFFELRDAWRNKVPYLLSKSTPNDTFDVFANLDAVLARTTLASDTTLMRAMVLDADAAEQLVPGATIENTFYVSTTSDPKEAKPWGAGKPNVTRAPKANLILTLLTPKGTHVIPGSSPLKEVVLGPGTRFRIRSSTLLSTGVRSIVADVI